MNPKTPLYKHTSILLAVAFVAGVGIGSISDSLKGNQFQTSVIQNSAFVRSLGKKATLQNVGKTLAYDVSEGEIIPDLAGDSTDLTPDDLRPVEPKTLPIPGVETNLVEDSQPTVVIDCTYEKPAKLAYKATPVTQSQAFSAGLGDLIRVSMVYKNEGSTPWFSDASGCKNSVVQLGTTRELDRISQFFNSANDSGWAANNRVQLTTLRVNPGEEGVFSFDMQTPMEEDLFREYFSVLVPGVKWIDDSESYVDVEVGSPYDRTTLLQKMNYLNSSVGAKVIDLLGTKSVEIDLSEQKSQLKLGDYVVREFSVSSGARKTPTPPGNYHIGFKEQVRIGGASPYYIMPVFQGLVRDGRSFVGYGFHALPSLGSASLRNKIRAALAKGEQVPTQWFNGDSLWSEALDHIGTPRSHGCVRFLPSDADFMFAFTDIGTPVVVHE